MSVAGVPPLAQIRPAVEFALRNDKKKQLAKPKAEEYLKRLANGESMAAAAKATWANLTTGGRAEELAASQAAVNKAQADLKLAQTTFARSQKLFASSTITQAQLDQDQAAVEDAQAELKQAEAQLAVTGLPGRKELQASAEASYKAAEESAAKADADLADRVVKAPVAGRVEQTYYDRGEMAILYRVIASYLQAGRP